MLKIGLVLESDRIPQLIVEFIRQCREHAELDVKLAIVLNQASFSRTIQPLAFRKLPLLLRPETFLQKDAEPFKQLNLSPVKDVVDEVVYWKSEDRSLIDRIKGESLDLLLHLGSSEIPSELNHVSHLGTCLLTNDQHEILFNRYLGLREMTLRDPVVKFSVIRTAPYDQGAYVQAEGSAATSLFPAQNQIRIAKKSLAFLLIALGRLADGALSEKNLSLNRAFQATRPHATSNWSAISRYIYRSSEFFFLLFVRHILLKKRYRWEVAFSDRDWIQDQEAQAALQKIPAKANSFFADPFVIQENDRRYCFLEELSYDQQKGFITAFDITEKPICLGTVLEEPFHLSFPYLFKYNNEIYMCPETSACNEIRVYRAKAFPYQWELASVLMRNVSAVDTMILFHHNLWWMLTNIDSTKTEDFSNELHLFSAHSPLAENWQPHPMNPIIYDATKARNAGLIQSGGQLYRVSQNLEFFRYGTGTKVHRINRLDKEAYSETECFENLPDKIEALTGEKDLKGHHHLFSDGQTTVFDYCRLINPQ